MKNNEKYDFIKEKLSETEEDIPSSISRDNIVSSLECVTQPEKIKTFTPKRAISLAASVAIVLLSIVVVRFMTDKPKVEGNDVTVLNKTETAAGQNNGFETQTAVSEGKEVSNASSQVQSEATSEINASSEKSTTAVVTTAEASSATEKTTQTTEKAEIETESEEGSALSETTTRQSEIQPLSKSEEKEYKDILKFFSSRWSNINNVNSDGLIIKGESTTYYMYSDSVTVAGSPELNAAPMPEMNEVVIENTQTTAVAQNNSSDQSSENDRNFGQTNTQVEDVDEADIIKNDGTYLYIALNSYKEGCVAIYRAEDLKLMSKITLSSGEDNTLSVSDIYLKDNRMVIMAQEDETANYSRPYYCFAYRIGDSTTKCFVYDISSKEEPKEIFVHTQSGSLRTSRLVGNILYTVSNYYVSQNPEESLDDFKSRCIPKVDGVKIPRDKIDFKDKNEESEYVVVSSCDISAQSPSGTSYAYLGMFSESYCTKDTLYLSHEKWTGEDYDRLITEIKAFSLSKDNISLIKEGEVDGAFLNQFSMDEYNGYFRCATTNQDDDWNDISSLYILDSDFKTVGKLENLADNEMIKSVRFMGDTAYIVTFENTDPLFVIDLSDPKNPKVDGEVKLPGFSAYLHPIGDNYIVGVGEGGNAFGTDGSVKVTLFDISDKKNPKVLSSYKVKNAYSEVEYNAKAFLYYPEKNIIGIPVSKYKEDKHASTEMHAYVLLKVENGELSLVNTYNHSKSVFSYDVDYEETYNYSEGTDDTLDYEYTEFFRGTYIDDTLYTASQNKICAFDIMSGEKLKEVKTRND